ncbi:response regulator [Candidatus Symbiobacter mobilis]|uniref:Virulence sensor protein BvgS n=1 Tax=Candidatus Symbiobacter mobilis CR TaxID=946483 RepID=U5N7L9_9BURK|nr:response regulator [Candidatus Symbiobacter mobilis]AGX87357.1 CheY-like chemotaxis protein [Candidatus Symbiobacter mobilis CR]
MRVSPSPAPATTRPWMGMGIRSRLGVSLTLWFLVVALVPLLGVTLFGLQKARENLRSAAVQTVIAQARIEAGAMQTYSQQILSTLLREARRDRNLAFMAALDADFQASGLPASSYVGSFRHAQLIDQYASHLQDLRLVEGFYDTLFVDPAGNILYTLAVEANLGANLFSGSAAGSRLANAVRKALDNGRPIFSDLEIYAPSNNAVSGFMAAPMIDATGQKIGVFVLQITSRNLLNALNAINHDRQLRSVNYLIGSDLQLRSHGPGADTHTDTSFLGKTIDTELTRLWHQQLVPTANAQSPLRNGDILTLLCKGPLGNEVVGAIHTLKLPEVTWAIVVEVDADTAFATASHFQWLAIGLLGLTILVVTLATIPITRNIVRPILALTDGVKRVRTGYLDSPIVLDVHNELGQLAEGFNAMVGELREAHEQDAAHDWLQQSMGRLNDAMRGDLALPVLARAIVDSLCDTLGVAAGAFYVVRNARIKLFGAYAGVGAQATPPEFCLGEGFVGQAALDRKTRIINDLPDDYFHLCSGLGNTQPRHLAIVPLSWNGEVLALLEFAMLHPLRPLDMKLLAEVDVRIAVTVQSALAREQTERLLYQTQAQAEELQTREEELRDSNRLLAQQANDLRLSEEGLLRSQTELEEKNEQLRVQQEELRVANEELAQRADELERATHEIERRSAAVAQASRYKSEFLANMSHELRTPLNSVLILARLLGENKHGNLDAQQIKYAQTIHDSGSDLLELINDILDLSKIEAGRMEVHTETMRLDGFVADIERKFLPLAQAKGIAFRIETAEAPEKWQSDAQKLTQIVRNLLSNAIKFTDTGGSVELRIGQPPPDLRPFSAVLAHADHAGILDFAVIDTGIGIPLTKRQSIFEAFQQADGTTSRKYGGTGLGLTISRELAQLLGGEIRLESQEGQGSQFHLLVPRNHQPVVGVTAPPVTAQTGRSAAATATAPHAVHTVPPASMAASATSHAAPELHDDRQELKPGDRAILIVEDDIRFAEILADTAHDRGFKVLLATDGETGLYLADYHQPSGIILDIGLPGISGLKVMERLKESSRTRHIPVHIMSAADRQIDVLNNGAVGFLVKPVEIEAMHTAFARIEHIIDRPVKRLLLVEDDPTQQEIVREMLGGGDLEIVTTAKGTKARELLAAEEFDCMVLDLGLDDMNGIELIDSLGPTLQASKLPVVIYTGRELEPRERHLLRQYARSVIIKDAHSPARLLDDTALFLHRVESNLPTEKQRMLRMLHDGETLFKGRKVLLVDDDMRNVFALSAALQEQDMQVIPAANGIEALKLLDEHPDVSLVLMDIMMPEMDGYEAMRRIRAQDRFASLPIIALTAKAMKGDRSKCIEAGASDYLAKPVDSAKLISMMRVWLYR